MLRINKVLIFFIFIITINFLIVWEVLQSKWVANNVSKVLTSYVNEVFEGDIKFSNLSFTMFPPGAEIKNVEFKGIIAKNEIILNSQKLGVYFNPIDAFGTKFMIHNVEAVDGVVKLSIGKDKSSVQSKSVTGFNSQDFELLEKIPLRHIGLEDIKIILDEKQTTVKNLQLTNSEKSIRVRGKLENIDLKHFSEINKKIDQAEFDFKIDDYLLRINTLRLASEYLMLSGSGDIESYFSKNIKYDVETKLNMPINSLHSWLDFEKIGKLNHGMAMLSSSIQGVGTKYEIKNELRLEKFLTDFIYGNELVSNINIDSEKIKVNSFSLDAGSQTVRLDEAFELYNFETKKFIEEPIIASVENLKFDNFLRYLRESTSMIKGSVSGKVRFDLFANRYTFSLSEKSKINKLAIVSSTEEEIISLDDFLLKSANFIIDNGLFSMNLTAHKNESTLSMNAKIGEQVFEINIPQNFVDFKDIGKIGNLNFEGRGILELNLTKIKKDLMLSANAKMNEFSFEGYKLDKLQTNLVMNLGTQELKLPNLKGVMGDTSVAANIAIRLSDKTIDGRYDVNGLTLSTAKQILSPLIGDISLSNKEFHGTWKTEGVVSGGLDINKLKLKSKISSKSTYIYDESLEGVSTDLDIENGSIFLRRFNARKSKGLLGGDLTYNIDKKSLKVFLEATSIPIQESSYYSKIPLNLRGNLSGSASLNFEDNKWYGVSKLKLRDTFVFNTKYRDSFLNVDLNDKSSFFNLELFGGEVAMESFVSLSKNNPKKSYVDLNLDLKNVRDILGIFSGVDLVNNNLSGSVLYNLKFDFDPFEFKINNYNSNMKRLYFKKSPIEVDYTNPNSEIIVENGKIKLWDTNIRGKKLYVISTGQGDLYKDFDTTTQIKIDSSILEVFNNIVYKAGGNIRGKLVYGHKAGADKYEANLTSNNLSLTTKFIPTAITKADMKISFKDGVLGVEKFAAQLVNGAFNLKGLVSLKRLIPDINLRYDFKNAGVVVMDKSNLVFSGSGSLIGKTFPYTLGGDFYIQKFILVNEITDYLKGKKSVTSSDIDYLPVASGKSSDQLINFNLNVLTREPIYIRNSLADLGFIGNLQVLGGERDPRIIGKIDLAPRRNKVTFKNNEFLFTKGSLFFVERNKYTNPVLDFMTTSVINNHKVSVKLVGPVKDYNLELSSEPTLSQSDILSLIAFGYTEDLSNNLSDSEKESMTRAGVGSIIFDSFKINETLKNEFGLQVNLGTSILQEEGSYLSGRTSEGAAGVGRVNSATTFEIKKKLNDAMSLSVSSTVGNNARQTQSMNLNYNLNNNVSLEGVYESNSRNDTETINIENSVGADVKLRWSFK